MIGMILTTAEQAAFRLLLRAARCEPHHQRFPDCWSIAWMCAAVAWQVRTWPPGEIVTCLSGPAPANTNRQPRPAA